MSQLLSLQAVTHTHQPLILLTGSTAHLYLLADADSEPECLNVPHINRILPCETFLLTYFCWQFVYCVKNCF